MNTNQTGITINEEENDREMARACAAVLPGVADIIAALLDDGPEAA